MAQKKEHVTWKINAVRLNDIEAMVTFHAVIDSGWHLYSQYVPIEAIAMHFVFDNSQQYTRIDAVKEESVFIEKYDSSFGRPMRRFETCASFTQKVMLTEKSALVNGTVHFTISSNDDKPVKQTFHFSVAVSVRSVKERIADN